MTFNGGVFPAPYQLMHCKVLTTFFSFLKGINGVSKIKDGYNPATWMLEVTTTGQEIALGVNFAEVYKNSNLFR